MNHAVSLSEASCKLFLVKVHNPNDIRNIRKVRTRSEVERPLTDTDLGEEMPANTIDLRQGQKASEAHPKHCPQSLLKGFGVYAVDHLVLTDDLVRWDDVAQACFAEGPTRNVR